MQYQVPQFIDTEDKIVGPFTLKQFAYVGVAFLISAFFYFLVQTWLFVIIAVILIGGALALSFVKINGRPLIKLATSAANFYWKPQTYVWKPDHPVAQQKPAPVQEHAVKNIEPMKVNVEAPAAVKPAPTAASIAAGDSLHKSWEGLQTGTPAQKQSARQFIENKMAERYEIFKKIGGDRAAARRVDYR